MDAARLEQFKEKLGLNADPFSARQAVFYEGAQRKHNLEVIRHMAGFGDLVMALVGERGTGKSYLIEEFSRRYADDLNIVTVAASGGRNQSSCIERLALLCDLDLPAGYPPQDLLEHLIDLFGESYARSAKRSLLVIDDAHLMSQEELLIFLTVMSSLEPESGAVLLLTGEPSLMNALVAYQHPDKSDWLHQILLKPLGREELEEYLMLRLGAAGFEDDLSQYSREIDSVYKVSKGVFSDIHRSFHEAILDGVMESSPGSESARAAPQYALFGIAILLLCAFLFLALEHGLFSFSSQHGSEPLALNQSDQDKRDERLALIEQALEQAEMLAPPDELVDQQGVEAVLAPEFVSAADPELATESPDGQSTDGATLSENSVVVNDSDVFAGDAVAPDVVVDLGENSISERDAGPEVADIPEVVGKAKESLGSKPSEEQHPLFRSVQWLKQQPSGAYTAQVLGTYTEKTAKDFADKIATPTNGVVYVKSLYKGKDWYVVLYGMHQNKAAARAALDRAAPEITKQKPWLRSVAGLL